jgi:hypothetical protein
LNVAPWISPVDIFARMASTLVERRRAVDVLGQHAGPTKLGADMQRVLDVNGETNCGVAVPMRDNVTD